MNRPRFRAALSLALLLALVACKPVDAPTQPKAKGTPAASTVSLRNDATAQLTGVASAPSGLVAAGGLNMVAAGGMNLVAAGGLNMVAAGGMNVISQNGASYALAQVSAAAGLSQRPLAGAEVVLVDAQGRPVAGVQPVKTDAKGRYTFPTVPGAGTYGVLVAVTQNGKDAALRTFAKTSPDGATANVDVGTSLVAAAVLAPGKGIPPTIDLAGFRDAAGKVAANMAAEDVPDLADFKAMAAQIERLGAKIEEVRAAVTQLGVVLARVEGKLDDANDKLDAILDAVKPSPSPSPTPVPGPAIAAVDHAEAAPGTDVRLTGTGFAPQVGGNAVTFGGVAGTVKAATATALTVEVPAGAEAGPITLTVGGLTATAAAAFKPVASGHILAEYAVGDAPKGLAIAPDGLVWVTNETSGDLSRVTPAGEVLAPIVLGGSPQHNAVDADGVHYAAIAGRNEVVRHGADGARLGVVSTAAVPLCIAFGPGPVAWITSYFGNQVAGRKPDGTVVADTALEGHLVGISVAPDGRVWAVNQQQSRVEVLAADGAALPGARYAVGAAPVGVAHDAAGNAWVVSQGAGNVTKLAPDGQVLGTFAVGRGPQFVVFDRQGHAWVTNQESHDVTRLNADGSAPLTVPVRKNPVAIALDPQGNLWIACRGDDKVVKIAP